MAIGNDLAFEDGCSETFDAEIYALGSMKSALDPSMTSESQRRGMIRNWGRSSITEGWDLQISSLVEDCRWSRVSAAEENRKGKKDRMRKRRHPGEYRRWLHMRF